MGDAIPTRAPVRTPPCAARAAAPGFEALLLESMASGVLGIDVSGAIAAMNPAARRILGCPAAAGEPVLGRPCREVLATRPQVVRLLEGALRRPHGLSRAELLLDADPDAAALAIGFTLSPVRDASGALRGAAMIFRDLAPIERSDERERLRDRLAALGQMAAGLAHEIRNPLASLEVAVGLLRRRPQAPPEDLRLLDEMLADLRGLAATVSASLEHVRPVTLDRGPLCAAALFEEALATALARIPFSGRIERAFAPDLPPLVGDADQLRAALTELVVNALEAISRRPGAARLALGLRLQPVGGPRADEERAREIVFAVSDDGPGIPAELREKVFYPFFTTRTGGSGLGLPSAQKLAAAHGGGIEIESRTGACTVAMRIPVEEDA